ncbi:MAG: hypothetical protein QOG62_2225 [Thermoleophilaceae bacterium]|nr:hypothetical protein [Thermoleophilaceae bacterium]
MSAMTRVRQPVGELWALLGALGVLVMISAGETGAGARPFNPPSIDPVGVLAPLVRAAGLDWSPPLLRSAAVIGGLLVAVGAIVLAIRNRPWPRWAAVALTLVVVLLLTVPGVALQAGLRQATAPWFHTNDSTFQIEIAGQLIRDGQNPYGHDYSHSGMERFYTFDDTEATQVNGRQVALDHFAYFPGTPLSAAAWGLLPQPFSDYRFLVLLCSLATGACALLFRGPLGWKLALGALLAASPLAIRADWFGQGDAPALLCLVLAFALITRRRWVWAAVAIAVAVLLKQFALFALPFVALAIWRRADRADAVRAACAFAALLAAGFLPFVIMDFGALWQDTIAYGGSTYPIIGYGLAPLLVKAGLLQIHGAWPFGLLALLVWLPVTLLLLRAQVRSGRLWTAAACFAASIYVLFFISRVFQETYVIWPLTAIVVAALVAIHEREEPVAGVG